MRELFEALATAIVLAFLILAALWLFVLLTGFPGHGFAACGTQGGFWE